MAESPIIFFPVDEALLKHGVSKIIISGTMCSIKRSSNDKDITFDIGKTSEKTLANFIKSARTLKLDDNLRAAIKLHFVIEYHNKKNEETKKKGLLHLRKLDENEDEDSLFDKEGEAERKERARRASLQYEEVTVPECVRMHRGAVKVVGGMISGTARLEKMISGVVMTCNRCNTRYEVLDMPRPRWKQEWPSYSRSFAKCQTCKKGVPEIVDGDAKLINAAMSELQEIESINGLERLPIVFLGDCTDGIMAAAGQPVTIYGEIFILDVKRKQMTFVFVYRIEYLQKQESLELSNADIEEFEKLAGKKDMLYCLSKKFAISVFGHEEIKIGILLSAVNSGEDSISLKRRINTALIVETGLAKSKLLYAACELVPKSKFCSAPTSSVRSWIAIVDKDTELGQTIRYGNIVLSSGAICAVDEIGRMPFEDQGLLLNAYQEGRIPFAKHGWNIYLPGSATFIVSSNPSNPDGVWRNSETVQLSEIPLLGPLRDRTDLIFIMRGNRNEDYLEDFALRKIDQVDNSEEVRKLEQENHIWLRKYLLFCKDFKPRVSEEAKMMLALFYRKNGGRKGSPRMVETLFNIGYAIARLKQKEVIDVEDAKEAMEFYNKQLMYWEQIEEIPADPRSFIRDAVIKKLENMKYSYEFTELVRQVCNDSKAAGVYIGKDFKIETNYKLRSIRDMFLNNVQHPDVMIVNIHPLQLAWAPTYIWNPNKTKDKNETSGASGASGASADYSKNGREQSSSHTDVAEATDATEVDKNTEADEYEKYKARTLERFDRVEQR